MAKIKDSMTTAEHMQFEEDTKIKKVPLTIMRKCEDCNGIGEVHTMEQVWPGEPHMAPVGSETCEICNGTGEVEWEIDIGDLSNEEEAKLREAHAKDYMGTDDDMPDDFEAWLELLTDEEIYKILTK